MRGRKYFLTTLLALSYAGAALGVDIDTTFPGGQNPTTEPGGIIANFYQFALMVGGVLAFGVIVYGGIKYTLAAGNPSGQSDGKEWIKGALLGLLLLVGAYLILNTINPNLTNLKLPTLEQIQAPAPSGGVGGNRPATHNECRSGSCIAAAGAGNNQCPQAGESCALTVPQHHLACNPGSRVCGYVQGPGPNECRTDPDCGPAVHAECKSMGSETVLCSNTNSCAGLTCGVNPCRTNLPGRCP